MLFDVPEASRGLTMEERRVSAFFIAECSAETFLGREKTDRRSFWP